MIQLGALDYASQFPQLWTYRPSLKLSRQAFSDATQGAAKKAADEVAETWKGDLDQPTGASGEPLFMPASSWFWASTEERRRIWRAWLMDNWLLDWEAAQGGVTKATKQPREKVVSQVRQAGEVRLEQGTKQMKTSLVPTWLIWAGLAVGGFIIWRATR